jgi:DNA polymerase-3 subunit delta'
MSDADLHPRTVFALEGVERAETEFLAALQSGRLHHAWMLVGPQGAGKATFAYRAARRLLGARPDPAYGPLGSSPDDPVSRQVSARSHPDLMVLEREVDEGKPRRNIPVDEARRLPEFFSKSPAASPWRVAIVDAADDLNVNAANAVLKTLEEPPARGVLLLVCHAPGRLLPTIRSRCRRLQFPPWEEGPLAAFLEARGVSAHDAEHLAPMAGGAPGRALVLAKAGALELDRAALELLRRLPDADEPVLLALAGELRGVEGAARLELLFERLADHVGRMVEETAGSGVSGRLEPWMDAWDSLTSLPGEAEALNLDRQDVFWTAVAALRQAAKA